MPKKPNISSAMIVKNCEQSERSVGKKMQEPETLRTLGRLTQSSAVGWTNEFHFMSSKKVKERKKEKKNEL